VLNGSNPTSGMSASRIVTQQEAAERLREDSRKQRH
jgi:hypothetical protein